MEEETRRRIKQLEKRFDVFDDKLTKGNELDIAIQKDMEQLTATIALLNTTLKSNYLTKDHFELEKLKLVERINENKRVSIERLKKLNSMDVKLKNLEVLSFFVKHPKLTGLVVLGLYLFALQDIRTGLIKLVQTLLF